MEETVIEKTAKASKKPSGYSVLHVRKETRRRVLAELAKVNKKEFGYRVRPDQYLALALSKMGADDIKQLQEESLTNADRLARDYREYVASHGMMSKDEYLGRRLRGELATSSSASESQSSATKNL
jgi:hypothetical protein